MATLHFLKSRMEHQDCRIEGLLSQLDDFENRSRRKNFRICWKSESVKTTALITTLLSAFTDILGKPPTLPIKIEWAHRALGPVNPDINKPRDVICKLLRYQGKETIMRGMRRRPYLEFEGTKLLFFPDLSRWTLELLDALRNTRATYRWGFPFRLTATKEGISATLRDKDDTFLQMLSLSDVDLPDWRDSGTSPYPSSQREWQELHRKRFQHPPDHLTPRGRPEVPTMLTLQASWVSLFFPLTKLPIWVPTIDIPLWIVPLCSRSFVCVFVFVSVP